MLSFQEFLNQCYINEEKFKIAKNTKFKLPTNIKKKKSFSITKDEAIKANEVIECIKYMGKNTSQMEFDLRRKNLNTLYNFGISNTNKVKNSVINKQKFVKLILNVLKPKDFCFDFKSDTGNYWLYVFVIEDFKNDSRFKHLNILNLENLEQHLYIKFKIIYDEKQIDTNNDEFQLTRSKDKNIYIFPKINVLFDISFHCITEL